MPPKRSTVRRAIAAAGVDRRRGRRRTTTASPALAPQPFGDPAAPRPPRGRESPRCAPSAAKCSAMPRPMPDVDPVISATLPSSGGHGQSEPTGSIDGRHEHGLDHPAIVHRVEGIAPAVERRAQADDRLRHASAPRSSRWITRSHTAKLWLNDPCRRTLPSTSGLTSTGMTSGDHPTLMTCPSGRASRSAGLERVARARRVADDVGAERRQRCARSPPSVLRLQRGVRRAEPPRRLEPRLVAGEPDDDQRVGAGESGHARAEQADRARAEDHHRVARTHRRIDAHRVERHRMRLGQAGEIERQRVRHVVQAARRHPDELGHRAVDRRSRTPCATGRGCSVRRGTSGTSPQMRAAVSQTTRSPSRKPLTRRPDCATVPPNSCPSTTGMFTGHDCVSRDWCTSEPQTETAPTSSSTSSSSISRNANLAQLDGERLEGVLHDGGLGRHDGVGTRFGDSDRTRGGSRVSMGSMARPPRPRFAAAVF